MQRIGYFAGVHGYPDPIEPALLSGGAAEAHHERPLSTILLMLPKPLVKAIESISARRNSISNRDYQATDRNGTGREATPAK